MTGRPDELGQVVPLLPAPVRQHPPADWNGINEPAGKITTHGHCWSLCRNDVGNGADGWDAPGYTGEHRSGHTVDDHGDLCVNDGGSTYGRDAEGERLAVGTAAVVPYHHGVYQRWHLYGRGLDQLVRVQVERGDLLLSEVFLDPGAARSLAAALLRDADLLEAAERTPRGK